MSFSPNNTTKAAENNLGGVSSQALNNLFPAISGQAQPQINTGAGNVTAGTNFLNTILGGNRAATTAMLQPNIDQINQGINANRNAISTLTPRGGGRAGTLFSLSGAPQAQVQNLFNPMRTTAATTLPQIGLAQQGFGGTLYGLANNALNTASGTNTNLAQLGQQDRATSLAIASALGQSLFKIATTPFGGGSATGGLFGAIPGIGN
jgi:hypothetical protein